MLIAFTSLSSTSCWVTGWAQMACAKHNNRKGCQTMVKHSESQGTQACQLLFLAKAAKTLSLSWIASGMQRREHTSRPYWRLQTHRNRNSTGPFIYSSSFKLRLSEMVVLSATRGHAMVKE